LNINKYTCASSVFFFNQVYITSEFRCKFIQIFEMRIYLKNQLVREIRGKIAVFEVRKEMIFGSSYWEVWKVKGLKRKSIKNK